MQHCAHCEIPILALPRGEKRRTTVKHHRHGFTALMVELNALAVFSNEALIPLDWPSLQVQVCQGHKVGEQAVAKGRGWVWSEGGVELGEGAGEKPRVSGEQGGDRHRRCFASSCRAEECVQKRHFTQSI